MDSQTPSRPAPIHPRRPRLFASLLALAAVIACLALLGISAAVYTLPQRAQQTFGPASPRLGLRQRITLSAQLLLRQGDLTRPLDPTGAERPFQVALGESTRSVCVRLQSEGFIPDASAFCNYLIYAGLDTSLQAGDYKLSPSQPALQIAHNLQDATPTEVDFHILPGWRIEEIAAALPTSGLGFTPEVFQAAALNPTGEYGVIAGLPTQASLEGFLLPDTYTLSRTVTVDGFLLTLLDNFDAQVGPDLREGFSRQALDLYGAVTLASIVEREAINEEEMPQIASVFLNRLSSGLKLDSDPTVQYALGYNAVQRTWWTNPLSLDDLRFDSPYNTYIYPGLPPGPLSSPALAALRAVAFPAQTPYYYFRAACDGSGRHVFAETFEEHLQNACP